MSRRGVDYSSRPHDWAAFARALKAAGYSFVGRYLSDRPKGITRAEYNALTAAGIAVYAYYETTEAAALEGYARGVMHARDALLRMAAWGADEAPVYFAVDTDTTGPRVEPYFRGVLSEAGDVQRVGAYGGYHVIRWLFDHELIAYAVQTEAWSRVDGVLTFDPRAQIRQYTLPKHGAPTIMGVPCDLNIATAEDFGQWNLDLRPKEDKMPIDVVHDPDAVRAAREKLEAAGLLTGRDHRSEDAASVGLLLIVAARLLDRVGGQVNLEDYELKLVRRTAP
ncbi:MAG: DUF1906 domain-containing protein [Actinobacteria bacterium]|nr:DUF1906 domain-containing protein [Actinomycetota bacterium]